MTDRGDFRRQFTSVMEKLLQNAVSETFQLFDSSVQELKAEIVQVKKDYESLKDKLKFSEDTRSCLELGNISVSTTKGNLRKCDIGVQCAGPTLVERSCSPCSQNQENESTLQDLCPSLSKEENQRLALVLIKQEELDLDDHSSGFFLLKQEDGEPKLGRKQPIKDIPPEVFVSSGVRRKTTKKRLSGQSSSESTTSSTTMDVEDHRSRSCQVQTRSNTEVKNDEPESGEANEKSFSVLKKATFSAATPAMEKQAVRSSQSPTVSTDSPTVQFSQPNESLKCSVDLSQSKIHSALEPVSKTSFPLIKKATFFAPTLAMEKQGARPSQGEVVSNEIPVLRFSTPNESPTCSVSQSQSKIHPVPRPSTLSPLSLHSPKSATPPQVSHFPAEFPAALLPELRPNQVASITNPSTQVLLSPVSHTVSQGQVQYEQNHMQVPRQQAPPFQGLPQTTQFPNSQPNIMTSAGQILFSPGISQTVFSPLQPRCMPVSSSLPVPPSLHTVQPPPHSNHWPPLQDQMPTQTQGLAPTMHFPGPVIPQGQPNPRKYSETQLPFTHMPTPPVPPLASFCNITRSKSPSVIPNMPSSPCPQASAEATVTQPGALPQASSPILSSVAPLPHIQSSFQGRSNTPAVSSQQGPSPYPAPSVMHLGPSTTDSAPPHMHPVTHLPSSPSCPVQSMPPFPLQHHPPHPLEHMLLTNLLQSSTPALIPATESFVSADSDPLENLFVYLDPVHDLQQEPTSTMVQKPNTMADNALSEHLSIASSQQCVPLTELGPLRQPPCVTPDQFNKHPRDDDKEIKQNSSEKTDKTQPCKKNKKCEVCGRVLSNAAALADHSRLHTGERPFSCDKCGKAFPSVRGLNRHAQIHTEEKQYRCLECGKTFVYHFTLTKHQRIHTGEKPFPCKICEKRFFSKSDRATHMRMHTGEKPFSCMQCGKKFKHRMAMNMHMQGHRGEKRHSCQICGKGFVDHGNFKRHSRVHTGEKPFECTVCGKKFTQSAHLKKHVSTQHD